MEDTHRHVYFWPRHPSFRRRALNTTIDEVLAAAMSDDDSYVEDDSSFSTEAMDSFRPLETFSRAVHLSSAFLSDVDHRMSPEPELQTAGQTATKSCKCSLMSYSDYVIVTIPCSRSWWSWHDAIEEQARVFYSNTSEQRYHRCRPQDVPERGIHIANPSELPCGRIREEGLQILSIRPPLEEIFTSCESLQCFCDAWWRTRLL